MEQKKLMAVLVLGQQCTLGNYKHKRGEREEKKKNLGLHSAQLSQIKKRTSASEQKGKKGGGAYLKRGDETEQRRGGKVRNKERGVDFMRRAHWTYVQRFVHLAD